MATAAIFQFVLPVYVKYEWVWWMLLLLLLLLRFLLLQHSLWFFWFFLFFSCLYGFPEMPAEFLSLCRAGIRWKKLQENVLLYSFNERIPLIAPNTGRSGCKTVEPATYLGTASFSHICSLSSLPSPLLCLQVSYSIIKPKRRQRSLASDLNGKTLDYLWAGNYQTCQMQQALLNSSHSHCCLQWIQQSQRERTWSWPWKDKRSEIMIPKTNRSD